MRGMIVLWAAVLSSTVLLVGCGNDASGNSAPSNGKKTAVYPAKVLLECAEPTTKEFSTADSKTQVIKVVEVTMGQAMKYLDVPDGWIESLGLTKIKDKPGALPGKATYVFEAPREDTYYINLRAKWLDSCGNSVWVKIDESPYYNLEDEEGQIAPKNYRWAWHQLEESGKPKGFKLTKGQHTLHFAVREDGPWLHQWVISTDANRQTGEAAKKPN
ncbi:MAG TPA: hypothetical protein VGP72_26640 [Planctomycetota bacterium]|jgi:hypothetical protein